MAGRAGGIGRVGRSDTEDSGSGWETPEDQPSPPMSSIPAEVDPLGLVG